MRIQYESNYASSSPQCRRRSNILGKFDFYWRWRSSIGLRLITFTALPQSTIADFAYKLLRWATLPILATEGDFSDKKSTSESFNHSSHLVGKSRNTFLNIFRLLYRFVSLILSFSRWALSLACPQGSCAAGAPNSFSRNRMAGIDPPSRM